MEVVVVASFLMRWSIEEGLKAEQGAIERSEKRGEGDDDEEGSRLAG